MITIPPIPTTIVATCFTALVAALACVQFSRSRTPLRLGSAVMAVCGLSISVLSIVYATDKMSLSIFWVYQFIAECIAVTWVISTIIQLGYAFYPLTRHQTLIWRTALASVIIYDLVAISELSYYCYAVWGSRSLGLESTPVVWIYWVRQLVKVLACAVTIAYLFVSFPCFCLLFSATAVIWFTGGHIQQPTIALKRQGTNIAVTAHSERSYSRFYYHPFDSSFTLIDFLCLHAEIVQPFLLAAVALPHPIAYVDSD
jgi:hypothetical protein